MLISSKRKLQTSVTDFTITTTRSQKEKLDLLVDNFFFSSNLLFNATNKQHFKIMITALRPDYTSSSPYQISGKLLDAACIKVKEELITQLQNCSLTLILDGKNKCN
jgi:hypothetical protein